MTLLAFRLSKICGIHLGEGRSSHVTATFLDIVAGTEVSTYDLGVGQLLIAAPAVAGPLSDPAGPAVVAQMSG